MVQMRLAKFNAQHDARGRFAPSMVSSSGEYLQRSLLLSTDFLKAHNPEAIQEDYSQMHYAIKNEMKSRGIEVSDKEVESMYDSVITYTTDRLGCKNIKLASSGESNEINSGVPEKWKDPKQEQGRREKYTKEAEALDRYIEIGPKYEGEMYRGTTVKNISQLRSGETYKLHGGPNSWSTTKGTADDFARVRVSYSGNRQGEIPVIFKYHGQATIISHLSDYELQREVLTPKTRLNYKIKSVEKKNKIYEVEIEETITKSFDVDTPDFFDLPVDDQLVILQKTIDKEILKFNPNHDSHGRFASGGGGFDSLSPEARITILGKIESMGRPAFWEIPPVGQAPVATALPEGANALTDKADYQMVLDTYTDYVQKGLLKPSELPKLTVVFDGDENFGTTHQITVHDHVQATINLNKTYANDPKLLNKSMGKSMESEFHPQKTGTLKGILEHELMHVLEPTIYLKIGQKSTGDTPRDEMNAHIKNHKAFVDSVEKVMSKHLVETPNWDPKANASDSKNFTIESVKTKLSGYANKSFTEFLTEAWSEYRVSPTPRPLAKELGKLIESELTGVKKFNQNHGRDGRFATGSSVVSVSLTGDTNLPVNRMQIGHLRAGDFGMNDLYNENQIRKATKELIQNTNKGLTLPEERLDDILGSIHRYTLGKYTDIKLHQKALMKGEKSKQSDRDIKDAENLETYIRIAPKFNASLYRGSVKNVPLNEGDTMSFNSLSSWTSDKGIANNFAYKRSFDKNNTDPNRPNKFETFTVYKLAQPHNAVSLRHISSIKTESEVLMSSQSKFRVKKISTSKEKYYALDKDREGVFRIVELEEITPLMKFNPWHDHRGRFSNASDNGYSAIFAEQDRFRHKWDPTGDIQTEKYPSEMTIHGVDYKFNEFGEHLNYDEYDSLVIASRNEMKSRSKEVPLILVSEMRVSVRYYEQTYVKCTGVKIASDALLNKKDLSKVEGITDEDIYQAKRLNAFIENGPPSKGELFRGSKFAPELIKKGNTITLMGGPNSWSTSKNMAKKFTEDYTIHSGAEGKVPVIMRFQGTGTQTQMFTKLPKQREVLTGGDRLNFKITKVVTVNGVKEVTVKEVIAKFNPFHDRAGRFSSSSDNYSTSVDGLVRQYNPKWETEEMTGKINYEDMNYTMPKVDYGWASLHMNGYEVAMRNEFRSRGHEVPLEVIREMRFALHQYSEGMDGYHFMKSSCAALKTPEGLATLNKNPDAKARAQALEKFIEKGPKVTGEIYRGMSIKAVGIKNISDLKNLKEIRLEEGPNSWTTAKNIAGKFAKDKTTKYNYIDGWGKYHKLPPIIIKTTTTATSVHPINPLPYQREVLTGTGRNRFKVDKVEKVKGIYEVTVNEVVEKFNPNHDRSGRFSTYSGGSSSFNYYNDTEQGRYSKQKYDEEISYLQQSTEAHRQAIKEAFDAKEITYEEYNRRIDVVTVRSDNKTKEIIDRIGQEKQYYEAEHPNKVDVTKTPLKTILDDGLLNQEELTTAYQVMKQNRNLAKEEGVLIDNDGKILKIKHGDGNSIQYSEGEVREEKGKIFIHNHPVMAPERKSVQIEGYSGPDMECMAVSKAKSYMMVEKTSKSVYVLAKTKESENKLDIMDDVESLKVVSQAHQNFRGRQVDRLEKTTIGVRPNGVKLTKCSEMTPKERKDYKKIVDEENVSFMKEVADKFGYKLYIFEKAMK